MDAYLSSWGEACAAAAKSHGATGADIVRFQTVCAFLADNPDLLSWRGSNKPSPTTVSGIQQLAAKFFGARFRQDWPSPPSTVPDEAVSIVLRAVYGYSVDETNRIKVEHQHAMSSENIVGALLERYIATILEPRGWVWCAGDFVKAVDFIKYLPDTNVWQSVQVKNRNNTENSSSAAIRNGTEIEKWFRGFANRDATNWAAFPEPAFRDQLSETGFREFLVTYLKRSG